jgi:hypothetical protein
MKEEQAQVDAFTRMRSLAAQNEAMRQQQMAQWMQQNVSGQVVTLFPDPQILGLTPDPPKKRTAKPEKSTEQAQEELTGIGKRKIIVDEEK